MIPLGLQVETQQDPVGEQKPLWVPHFFIKEVGFIQPPGPSLSPTGRFRQMLTREGRAQRQGRSSERNSSAASGQVLIPSGDTQTGSLSCFADTERPTRREKLTVCRPQARGAQTCWNQKVEDADSRLPHHPSVRGRSVSGSHRPPLWASLTIKLLTTPTRWGHTWCWGRQPALAPFAWQSHKAVLFYFTENSVSEI